MKNKEAKLLLLLLLTPTIWNSELVNEQGALTKPERRLMSQENVHLAIKSKMKQEGYDYDEFPEFYQVRDNKDILFTVFNVPDPLQREGFFYVEFTNKDSLYSHRMRMSKTVLINPALDKPTLISIIDDVKEPFEGYLSSFWGDRKSTEEMVVLVKDLFKKVVSEEPKTEEFKNGVMTEIFIKEDSNYKRTKVTIYSLNRLYFALKFETGSQELMVNISRFVGESQENSIKQVIYEVTQKGWSHVSELFNFEILIKTVSDSINKICVVNDTIFKEVDEDERIALGKVPEDDCPQLRGADLVVNYFVLEDFRFAQLIIDNVLLTNEYFISAESLNKFTINLDIVLNETSEQVMLAANSLKEPEIKEVSFEDLQNLVREESEGKMQEKDKDNSVEFWAGGRPLIILKKDIKDDEVEGFVISMRNKLDWDMAESNAKEYYIYPENGFDQLEFMKPSLIQYITSLGLDTIRQVPKAEGEESSEDSQPKSESSNSSGKSN